MRAIVSILTLSIALAGCSHQSWYDGIQTSKRNDCMKLPQSEADQCLNETNKTYQEYERERQEALER
ncbi:hypothetical protein K0504_04835 [Neiella marina]|uniref:Lipoprotein n=1 Tax=Neiella holothuriorum TaxID=2870530 RepID=A0ABS7EDD8_9GAMM|nr:hypothetical protein [Neiella holothuriorum]MBW8190354.1 hypothetical protein [Neiella holothuriorum]